MNRSVLSQSVLFAAVSCVSLAGQVGAANPSITWAQTPGGTYAWNSNGNWNAGFPNAAGAVANFNIDLAGDQTINLNQGVTLETLNAGDAAGTSGVTITSGTGSNTLTFQSATAGGATSINNTASTGWPLIVTANVKLGGTSPLNLNLNGATGYNATFTSLNLNGNTFTVNPANSGIVLGLGTVTGNGAIVLNGAGVTPVTGGAGGIGLREDANYAGFTGSITVNNGRLSLVTPSLSSLSTLAVGGAFQQNNKYPQGGMIAIGNDSVLLPTLADRMPHNGTLVFNGGGYFDDDGAALAPALAGQPIVEQVKTIQFNPGISEIRLRPGPANSTGASTLTFLANDPTNALVRAQGATFMAGGDDGMPHGENLGSTSEMLKFNSGVASQLKGGGGPAGSQNQSIIPWMVVGTLYHPATGGFATYDSARGVHSIPTSDYYTGTVLGAPADVNILSSNVNLGTGHSQTVNSYWSYSLGNTDIGPGSTLTVSSGAILFTAGGNGFNPSIGNGTPANAGTLNFGAAEGIIFTEWAGVGGTLTIGSRITGSGGLTMSGTTTLILKGANAYTGKTTVGGGILQVGDGTLTTSKLGVGDLLVCAGATVRIKTNIVDGIANTGIVSLVDVGDTYYGTMALETGVNETVAGLLLGDVAQPAGTYGSTLSAATFKNDTYFSGPGVLTVVPEPCALGAMGAGAGAWLLRRRRSLK